MVQMGMACSISCGHIRSMSEWEHRYVGRRYIVALAKLSSSPCQMDIHLSMLESLIKYALIVREAWT